MIECTVARLNQLPADIDRKSLWGTRKIRKLLVPLPWLPSLTGKAPGPWSVALTSLNESGSAQTQKYPSVSETYRSAVPGVTATPSPDWKPIPNGVDLPTSRAASRTPMAADALSAVAILIGNARARFAEFAALPAEAKAQLTVLGDDKCRATFEEQAARLGLSSRVTFAGAVEDVFPFCWTLIFIFRCRKACQRPATSLSSLRIVAWIPFGERACESDASAQEFSSPFRRCEPIETKRALSILDRLSRETLESVF
ncbi:MAG: glycosyltransferase [Mesorhizobium sp.]|uniref:hypothetical protein n=1 Tax=Mesorhizobium sp. TaxID=1871066 RepID=UPI0011F8A68D|nr:hypothetical protein [Mesorhizobium sp.]TIR32591.1 MAG: glycosyltransferase [Mesorhizobium sp.]TIS29751.1 MAG: glycosyltransferase [Mesorhizobium sp.]